MFRDRWGWNLHTLSRWPPDKHAHSPSLPRQLSMSLTDFFGGFCSQEIKLFFSYYQAWRSNPHPMSPQLLHRHTGIVTGPDGVGIVPIPVPAPALQGPLWVTTIDLSKWVVQHGTFKDCETFGNFEDTILVSDFIERVFWDADRSLFLCLWLRRLELTSVNTLAIGQLGARKEQTPSLCQKIALKMDAL